VFKVFELIEAGASGGQQDGVTGARRRVGVKHCGFERPALHRWYFSVQMIFNFIGRRSD
jgi:hypothetical protein